MTQMLFIGGIYLLGFCFGLLFRKRIPFPFIALTGFLWGCMLYVIEVFVLYSLGIPYNLVSATCLTGLVLAILSIVNFLLGNWRLSRGDISWLAGIFLVFTLASLAANLFNMTVVTLDSLRQIMVGREIAFDGFTPGVIDYLSSTGPFMLVLHSAGVLIGSEYLYTLIPCFSLSLFMIFIYVTFRSINQKTLGRFFALALTLLAALVLFSSTLVIYQSFYIHTNLPTAVYLFVAVATCWLAISEENDAWLAFAVPSLVCVSLLRTETFLFAVFILFLVISLFKFSGRTRWFFTLPFLGLMLLWYILFYVRFSRDTNVLSPARILLLVFLLVCLGLYVFILRYRPVEQLIRSTVFYVVGGGVILLMAGLLLFKTHNTITSLVVTLQNMFITGWWGAIWYAAVLGLVLAFTQPRFKNEHFFVLVLGVFFVFMISLGSIRTLPYHLGWFDSGNRMLIHILPLVWYYLVLKYAPAFMKRAVSFETWFNAEKSSVLKARP